jgi:protein tyrosine phosphatase (PTP) superfamily phosphohydrolase (DUF442 family)
MIEGIKNYLPLTETLMSSGMPTEAQLRSLAENKVDVVINLATSKSADALPDEKGTVESLGMRYFNIPVDWNNPTPEDLDQFMKIMDDHRESRILVHCQANYRATGFITLYRILRLGWKREDAFQDLQKIWNPRNYPVWHKFIEESLGAQK